MCFTGKVRVPRDSGISYLLSLSFSLDWRKTSSFTSKSPATSLKEEKTKISKRTNKSFQTKEHLQQETLLEGDSLRVINRSGGQCALHHRHNHAEDHVIYEKEEQEVQSLAGERSAATSNKKALGNVLHWPLSPLILCFIWLSLMYSFPFLAPSTAPNRGWMEPLRGAGDAGAFSLSFTFSRSLLEDKGKVTTKGTKGQRR